METDFWQPVISLTGASIFMLFYAIAAYYDLFRSKLSPNSLAWAALGTLVIAHTLQGTWSVLYIVLAAIVFVVTFGLAMLTGGLGMADVKWMTLTALAIGPVAYFALTAGLLIALLFAIPLAIRAFVKKENWRKAPLPLLPSLFLGTLTVLIWQDIFTGSDILIAAVVIIVGIIWGLIEYRRVAQPTLKWLLAQDTQATSWSVDKGKAISDQGTEVTWSRDRHRIFLKSALPEEAWLCIWDNKPWQGEHENVDFDVSIQGTWPRKNVHMLLNVRAT